MKFTIEIDLDNAAFMYCPACEVHRILKGIISNLLETEEFPEDLTIRDINGNNVGFARLRED